MGTQQRRFGRWYSISSRRFSGSMLTFQDVLGHPGKKKSCFNAVNNSSIGPECDFMEEYSIIFRYPLLLSSFPSTKIVRFYANHQGGCTVHAKSSQSSRQGTDSRHLAAAVPLVTSQLRLVNLRKSTSGLSMPLSAWLSQGCPCPPCPPHESVSCQNTWKKTCNV